MSLAVLAQGMKAGGGLIKGISANQKSKYTKALADRNAVLSNQQATAEAEVQHRAREKELGSAAALAGASGFDLTGSASDIMAQLAGEATQRAATSIYEGEQRSEGFRQEGRAAREEGRSALISGVGGFSLAGATLLTATSKSKHKYKSSGGTP